MRRSPEESLVSRLQRRTASDTCNNAAQVAIVHQGSDKGPKVPQKRNRPTPARGRDGSENAFRGRVGLAADLVVRTGL